MSSEEVKYNRKRRRDRKITEKHVYDPNDYKGAFSIKVIQPKEKYKREKYSPRNINTEVEEDE